MAGFYVQGIGVVTYIIPKGIGLSANMNIDAQDEQDVRFLHRKSARAMSRYGLADA